MNENQSWVKFNKKTGFTEQMYTMHMINVGHILSSFYIIATLSLQNYCIFTNDFFM